MDTEHVLEWTQGRLWTYCHSHYLKQLDQEIYCKVLQCLTHCNGSKASNYRKNTFEMSVRKWYLLCFYAVKGDVSFRWSHLYRKLKTEIVYCLYHGFRNFETSRTTPNSWRNPRSFWRISAYKIDVLEFTAILLAVN